jgi:hypothetical protein
VRGHPTWASLLGGGAPGGRARAVALQHEELAVMVAMPFAKKKTLTGLAKTCG